MSITDICNQALGMIGANNKITSMTEDSDEARNCNLYYNQTRLELLQAVPWGFTRRQTALALVGSKAGTDENPDGTQPLSDEGWNYTYMYPVDCVKPLFIIPSDDDLYETEYSNMGYTRSVLNASIPYVEGIKLLDSGSYQRVLSTDKQSATLLYQADVSNTALFPSDFNAVLIHSLSAKLAVAVISSPQLGQVLGEGAKRMLFEAQMNHALTFNGDRKILTYGFTPDAVKARY